MDKIMTIIMIILMIILYLLGNLINVNKNEIELLHAIHGQLVDINRSLNEGFIIDNE